MIETQKREKNNSRLEQQTSARGVENDFNPIAIDEREIMGRQNKKKKMSKFRRRNSEFRLAARPFFHCSLAHLALGRLEKGDVSSLSYLISHLHHVFFSLYEVGREKIAEKVIKIGKSNYDYAAVKISRAEEKLKIC